MSWNDDEITPKILLQHMQAGFQSIDKQFQSIDKRFDRLEIRMDRLETRMDTVIHRLDFLDSHDLPDRVSRLEDKVFAGVDPE